MMLQTVKCSFFISTAAIVLIQLFSSFNFSQGSELPLELLQAGGSVNMDYARRMAFPLASNGENDIELPPHHVDDNLDLKEDLDNRQDDDVDDNLTVSGGGAGMPKWLQMQLQTDNHQQQHSNNYVANRMHKQQHKQQHKHQHRNDIRQSHAVSTSPLKRCSIEITNKIPGICQAMGTIGNACVSGEYLDVFNADCF